MIDNGTTTNQGTVGQAWPAGRGEAAELIRSDIWSGSPIGAPESWPTTLRTTVDLMLACEFAMVVLWGQDLVQIYNNCYLAVMGSKHPAGMGQKTQECWPEVWQFNQPIYERVWNGESVTLQDQLFPITRHGFREEAYFTLCYSPIRDGESKICGVLVTLIETTSKVEATRNERLRLALSAASGMGIWDWDVVKDRLFVDSDVAMIYGIDPKRAASGIPLAEATRNIHPEDKERVERSMEQAVREGAGYVEEYRVNQQDGSVRWVIVRGNAILSTDGEATRFPGVITDVTDRKRTEEILRQSEKLVAVGRLASIISHEINNPLEAVTNLLYLARTGEAALPPDVQGYLDLAQSELRRVSAVASQTLRFHKQATNPLCVSCEDLIGGALTIYHGRIVGAKVRVEKRKRAKQAVSCFEGEIGQVLNNLIGNAIDSMRPSGGRLLLRSREATHWETGRRGLVLTIADTGSGIDPAVKRKMFEAFVTTKGISGTGLGLWVSKEIMERHNGEIRVRSRQGDSGSGTVFTLFLPFQAATR
jgi:signal transduction histidine kinase